MGSALKFFRLNKFYSTMLLALFFTMGLIAISYYASRRMCTKTLPGFDVDQGDFIWGCMSLNDCYEKGPNYGLFTDFYGAYYCGHLSSCSALTHEQISAYVGKDVIVERNGRPLKQCVPKKRMLAIA
eukprot:Nk52_evm9s2010 gene=Nk52_evmTU9s2010